MNRNAFVDFINQFYSQNVSQSAGYTELSSERLEGISLKTDHLVDDVVNGKVKTVILTGNAGDGKTYICSQLYEKLTGKNLPIKKIIEEKTGQGWTLNMIKDASEVPASELGKFLADMESNLSPKLDNNCIFILAGNEGKLSEVFDRFNLPRLQELLNKALRPEFVDEVSLIKKQGTEWASVKILNFNWRDLTEENTFKSIVKAFSDTRKWETACHKCDFKDDCPIFLNARLLRNDEIIGRIRTLFRFYRCIEGHFTLRELFSAISYILTAGLNCLAIKDVKENHRQLSYMFYNNIFSRHNLGAEDFSKPMDRVLRGLQKFDVVNAPLAKVNKGVVSGIEKLKNFPTPKQSEQSDLLFFKSAGEKEIPEYLVLDAFKRRFYFFNKQNFWGDYLYLNLSDIINIDPHYYLPFSSFREFDTFISKEIEAGASEYENIKRTIIRGLNLLANRDDDTADFWLKVYKPSENQSQILELFGDIVETIDIQLSTQNPVYDANYIEFANTEFYFSLRVQNHQAAALRLPITIEIYEGLWAAARRNQSKQGFGYLERVIKEFRESLYYRILEKTGSRKFKLNTPFRDNKGAVEVFTEKDRVMMRGR